MLNDAKLSSSLLFRKHEFGCKEKNQGSGVPLPIFFFVAESGHAGWQATQ